MSRKNSITVQQLMALLAESDAAPFAIIDARKRPAAQASGRCVAGAVYRSPFNADNWHREFAGQRAVVFCVHGHEVSQALCGFLRDHHVDAVYLEGGFEAWAEAGGETIPSGANP